jgi:hypothetical protein
MGPSTALIQPAAKHRKLSHDPPEPPIYVILKGRHSESVEVAISNLEEFGRERSKKVAVEPVVGFLTVGTIKGVLREVKAVVRGARPQKRSVSVLSFEGVFEETFESKVDMLRLQ